MKEWRRTLKSWPMETAKIADPASLPSWVREAARERREAESSPKGQKRLTVLLLGLGLALLVVIELLPSGDPLTWILIGGLLAAVVPFGLSIGRSVERAESRRRNRAVDRLEALGESTLGGEFVRVGYADGCWTYPGLGEGADEGILKLELDRLTFVGRYTRFALPASAVLGTEIRRRDSGVGSRARLIVSWTQGGQAGTLSVALPHWTSTRRRVSEALELRERIERWRKEPFPHRALPPLLPIAMELTPKPNAFERVGLTAKILSGVAVLALGCTVLGGVELGLAFSGMRELGGHVGGLFSSLMWGWFFLWVLIAAKIEALLPERYRFQEKGEPGVRGAIRTVETTIKPETVADVRLKQ